MTIRLIALDLDGTTLTSENKLAEKTRATLEKAADSGVVVVPVTGRCFKSLPPELLAMKAGDCIQYAVTSNGAEIREMHTGKIVYENYIEASGIEEIKEVFGKMDVMMEVYVKGCAYIEQSYYKRIEQGRIAYRDRDYVLSTRLPVWGVKQLLDVHKYKIEKIAVYFKDEASRRDIWEKLRGIEHARVTSSGRNNIELIGKNCSKAGTLKVLCDRLGISMSEIMAAGDSLNDLDMLKAAGFSVAMGNAEECVKQCADYITADNDCDGLAKAIERQLFHIV